MPDETPTPRTDAAEVKVEFTDGDSFKTGYVTSDFARTLERDLIAAQAEVARLKSQSKYADECIERCQQAGAECEVKLASQSALIEKLVDTLQEISDDYADRFDLESPSTNPGIKHCIKNARAILLRSKNQASK